MRQDQEISSQIRAISSEGDTRTPRFLCEDFYIVVTLGPELQARSTSSKAMTKSSSHSNRLVRKVSTRLYNRARIGVPPPKVGMSGKVDDRESHQQFCVIDFATMVSEPRSTRASGFYREATGEDVKINQ